MSKSNTLLRAEFIYKFGLLSVYAGIKGIKFIVYRFIVTAEQQNRIHKIGRTRPGRIITNCDGYIKVSKHQKARAKDLVIIDDRGKPIWDHIPEYDILGKFWECESIGGCWGGQWFQGRKTEFDDCYHFEY